MVVVENADDLTGYYSDDILNILERHTLPIVFMADKAKLINSSSTLVRRAHFIIDCYPPSLEQRVAMCRQFLDVELSPEVLAKMPDITLDVFKVAQYKRFKVLQDPNDLGQIEALLLKEYRRSMSGADEMPVAIDKLPSLAPVKNTSGGKDPWGPAVRF